MIDWNGIVERDGPAVWRVCWRLLGHRADAEECFQEAFIAAFELAARQPLASPKAILLHMAAARSIDRLRARQRQRNRYEPATDATFDNTANTAASPVQNAEATELTAALRNAMTTLPAKQAEAFFLHAIEGWSYQEISRQLGASVENVGVLIHRARAKLKTSLQRFAPLEPTATPQTSVPTAGKEP